MSVVDGLKDVRDEVLDVANPSKRASDTTESAIRDVPFVGSAMHGYDWTQKDGPLWTEDAKQRWNDTKDDPLGTFADNLRFGLTGPAPSLQPDEDTPLTPSIDWGPPGLSDVNKKADEVLSNVTGLPRIGNQLGNEDGSLGSGFKLLLMLALAALLASAFGPVLEAGATLADDR